MRQISDQNYAAFTPTERLYLTLAAMSREDEAEVMRLWDMCPTKTYRAQDMRYTQGITTFMAISYMMFSQCVYRYNIIQDAKYSIAQREAEHEIEISYGLHDLAALSNDYIQLAEQLINQHTVLLKSLFCGMKSFCEYVGLDDDIVLKTIPINQCCKHLESILKEEIATNDAYIEWIKQQFVQAWQL